MNLGRGSGSRGFWTPGNQISQDSGIGRNGGSWMAAMHGGPIPIPDERGSLGGGDSWNAVPRTPVAVNNEFSLDCLNTWAIPGTPIPLQNGIMRMTQQENGIVQSSGNWNQAAPGNGFPQESVIASYGRSGLVTPEKVASQQSTAIPMDNQGNQEVWQDIVGFAQDMLQKTTLDLNGLVKEMNTTPPAPTAQIQSNGQPRVVGAAKRNLTLHPNPNPNPIPDHSSNQGTTSLSYFPSEDPANWNCDLLAALVQPKKNSELVLPTNGAQNNSVHVLEQTLASNVTTQVESNWAGSTSASPVLVSNQTQPFPSNQLLGGSKQSLADGFPVPFRPYYNLNSPPRSEPDTDSCSILNSSPLAPITPDCQWKNIDNQWVQEKVNFPVGESSTLARESNGNQMVPMRIQEADYQCNELLQTVGDSSSSAVSTTHKENVVSEEGDEQGIDLNKTPQQKTPARRKKHRPKVIIEGKPKRTPKPKDPKSTPNENRPKRKYVRKKGIESAETPKGNSVDEKSPVAVPQTGKRKYVRKKGVDNLESQQQSKVDEVAAPTVEEAPACKKKLNFDIECAPTEESQDRRGSHQGINLNANPQDVEQERRINNMDFVQQNEYIGGRNSQESSYRSHMPPWEGNLSMLEQHVSTTPLVKAKEHALNMIARNLTLRNSASGQDQQRYNQVHQNGCGAGISNRVFQAGSSSTNVERAREQILQSTSQPFASRPIPNFDERRGIKRQSFEQMHAPNIHAMASMLMYQQIRLQNDPGTNMSNELDSFLENHKRTRTQSKFQIPISSEPSHMAPLEDNSRQEVRRMDSVFMNGSAVQLLNSCERGTPSYNMRNAVGRNVDYCHYQPPMSARQNLQKPQISCGMQSQTERFIAQRSAQGRGVNSATAMVSWNPPATPPKETSGSAIVVYPGTLLDKKQSAKPNSSNQRLDGVDNVLHQYHNDASEAPRASTKAKGRSRKQKIEVSIDELIYRLEQLCIYSENEKEQNALVPYRGENSIIPFEPIKKRKPRPKVDLDPETDRLWKLLMGKEGSEAAENLDEDKEKWWENERRVFRGRAESFIARMHLVQGDRRFSRWKGSVVDSVIGVFLTQNVSDHLSSSAFMSLAAKYPIKPTTTTETSNQDGACVLVEEPIETIYPDDSIKCPGNLESQLIFNKRSCVSHESADHITHRITPTADAVNMHNRVPEEEVVLSQDSFDSSTVLTVDEIRSSSGSNSEAEDQTTGFETSKESGQVNLIQAEKVTRFKELFNLDNWSSQDERSPNMLHESRNLGPGRNIQPPRTCEADNLNGVSRLTPPNSDIRLMQESPASSSQFKMNMTQGFQKVGSLCFGLLGGESISSLPSSNSGLTEAYQASNTTYQQHQMPRFHPPALGQYDFLNSNPNQENFHPGPHIGGSQHPITNSHHAREVSKETTKPAETQSKNKHAAHKQDSVMLRGSSISAEDRISVVDKQNCLENTTAEANSKEQHHSSQEPLSGAGKNTSKARKGISVDEKTRTFDWDSLRIDVLSNGERKERTKDARDSIDYEALRSAHVNEISDAIRERGMNNMLAERIKDFLNRLVKDHGSIDLEWLRDVPADKAKDYLLSIRGLGLKSVECVRLLTLHHLAFPVDTNVGRIAVRLGWVPLQPLPESLQLHLLEMYPVLETIQKYLWPRLCKLDQLTLYELHYQMITFGKVFCTKSKPNCNACPMRAECRHFASAFASARLALPGPEEKRVVTTDAPIATERTSPVVGRPMPLPPAKNNCNKNEGTFEGECLPIIEEPKTPEPETAELSISDIEDQYYDDSDEIPTIKLNMEEFTTNLQNIMQDNMELQGDMSKALVALNPEAASIPTPKLKNVSRLRTEHQVYELPDSHPLLEGFDKREPDDPSPYLLAIWTPGETANSVQPPEKGCQAQESGKLCDRTTCFSCNSVKEANSQVVRGTLLIPCRTAMRGSFPLNGTYFQVNEMFADHASSLKPIDVPRAWIWNLPRRTVYFGTSVSTIFKGLTTEGIQFCFWRGFVCVRGFDQKTRAPKPLMARLHFPASKLVKTKNEGR